MSAADWIDDLERKAKAATPGPWSADGYGSGQQVTGATGTIFADTLALRENAEFIAAANPTTILRLIEECNALAARLAAVKAAIDRADPPGQMKAGTPSVSAPVLRAALSAAPTDTTKENS